MFRWLVLSLCITFIHGVDAQWESFGRLSRTEGEVYVLKLGSTDWEYGVPNLLIEGGDIVKTEADDFAEIELENGTLIRMDEVTEVRVQYLHKDSDNGEWMSGIDLLFGVLKVHTPKLKRWAVELEVETPNGFVSIGEESLVKVIVRRSGASRVIAYSGDVLVGGEWDELCLNGGEAVWISASGKLERPERIYTVEKDRFDRWCEKYSYVQCESRNYIHTDVYIGVHYLDTYGDWVWLIDCGRVWRPRVRAGWCPYRRGRWTWSVGFGWFWVSYEPWGWVPFHYGRWAYSPRYGWVWIPGNVWGPGWVAWSHGPGWIGWVPLGLTDRPVGVDDARTIVASDCFFSRLKKRERKEGYAEYLQVNVEKEVWSKKQPGRVVKEREEIGMSHRVAKYEEQEHDRTRARNFEERNSARYPHSKKKVRRMISRAEVNERAEEVQKKEHPTWKRKAQSPSRTREIDREEIRRPRERRVRKTPVADSDEKKPKFIRKNKPKSGDEAVGKRPAEARSSNKKPKLIRRSRPKSQDKMVKKPVPSQRRK